jgi:hypothetical protein
MTELIGEQIDLCNSEKACTSFCGMCLGVWIREALLAAPVSHSEPDLSEISLTELLAQRSLLLHLQFLIHHAGN